MEKSATQPLTIEKLSQALGDEWVIELDYRDADFIKKILHFAETDPTVLHLWGNKKIPPAYYYAALAASGWEKAWLLKNTRSNSVLMIQPPDAGIAVVKGFWYTLRGLALHRWPRLINHSSALLKALQRAISKDADAINFNFVGFSQQTRFHEEAALAAGLQQIAKDYGVLMYRVETQRDTLNFCSENGWRVAESYRLYGMNEPLMILILGPNL